MRPADPDQPVGRPLLVTADLDLLDDLLRLAAAAGVEPEVAVDAGSAGRSWSAAPLVLVGDDLLDDVVRSRLLRRPEVVVVAVDPHDEGVWQRAVGVGADGVVFLPDGEPALVDRLASAASGPPAGVVVCVLGGRGGAGASTLAVALAVTARRLGRRTVVVDADPLGGGIDLVLGAEDAAGARWPDLAEATGRIDPATLRAALPQAGGLCLLSWDRGTRLSVPAAAMAAVLDASVRDAELVVVDLPRHVDPAAEEALARASVTFLVVPAELRAIASAARVAAGVGLAAADLRVVVRGPAPSGISAASVATALGLPLAGEARADAALAAALERGDAPAQRRRGPLARLAERLLDDLLEPPRRHAA